MDNGLVLGAPELSKDQFDSLNPFCNGQWSRTY